MRLHVERARTLKVDAAGRHAQLTERHSTMRSAEGRVAAQNGLQLRRNVPASSRGTFSNQRSFGTRQAGGRGICVEDVMPCPVLCVSVFVCLYKDSILDCMLGLLTTNF